MKIFLDSADLTEIRWATDAGTKQAWVIGDFGCGEAKLAELLITRQADVNRRGINGATPLHAAITNGNQAAIC